MDGYEFERAEIDALERVERDPSEKPIPISFWLLRRITNDFSHEFVIGRGGTSTVYLGVLPNGLHVAVKKFVSSYTLDRAFENEICNTVEVAHKNIVRLLGYCCHSDAEALKYEGRYVLAESRQFLICMEYAPKGTLDRHIDNFHVGLGWNQRYKVFKGICHGLRYLHDELHIIHRDIKAENILLDANLVPKISDFGFAKCINDGHSLIDGEGIQGTLEYLAPESLSDREYSFKSDIFSFGVMLMKSLFGLNRASEKRNIELVLKQLRKRLVKEGAFSSWENKYQQVRTCLEIGYNCLDADPDKRPSALEIIHLLDETESTNYSVSSGHAPPLWQPGDEGSDSSDVDAFEPERTPSDNILPSVEEPASVDTTGETSTEECDMPDLVNKLSVSVELSSLDFLEKITDGFSHQ